MLKYYNSDVVFQEIPDEVTLAVNLTGCPCHCPGCHSPQLWKDIGDPLDEAALRAMYEEYAGEVTCIALMGGDADPAAVEGLCVFIKRELGLKSAWYSGRSEIPAGDHLAIFDYIKTGPYVEALGGLRSPNTNQRLYRVDGGRLEDITFRFWR